MYHTLESMSCCEWLDVFHQSGNIFNGKYIRWCAQSSPKLALLGPTLNHDFTGP